MVMPKPLGKNGCPTEPRLSQLATTCSRSSIPGPELFPGCLKRAPEEPVLGGLLAPVLLVAVLAGLPSADHEALQEAFE